jgi:pyrrolidone-carboxylate peptidase
MESESRTRPYVLVTGFGPFGMHKINASSEAVKTIRQMNLWSDTEVRSRGILSGGYCR